MVWCSCWWSLWPVVVVLWEPTAAPLATSVAWLSTPFRPWLTTLRWPPFPRPKSTPPRQLIPPKRGTLPKEGMEKGRCSIEDQRRKNRPRRQNSNLRHFLNASLALIVFHISLELIGWSVQSCRREFTSNVWLRRKCVAPPWMLWSFSYVQF